MKIAAPLLELLGGSTTSPGASSPASSPTEPAAGFAGLLSKLMPQSQPLAANAKPTSAEASPQPLGNLSKEPTPEAVAERVHALIHRLEQETSADSLPEQPFMFPASEAAPGQGIQALPATTSEASARQSLDFSSVKDSLTAAPKKPAHQPLDLSATASPQASKETSQENASRPASVSSKPFPQKNQNPLATASNLPTSLPANTAESGSKKSTTQNGSAPLAAEQTPTASHQDGQSKHPAANPSTYSIKSPDKLKGPTAPPPLSPSANAAQESEHPDSSVPKSSVMPDTSSSQTAEELSVREKGPSAPKKAKTGTNSFSNLEKSSADTAKSGSSGTQEDSGAGDSKQDPKKGRSNPSSIDIQTTGSNSSSPSASEDKTFDPNIAKITTASDEIPNKEGHISAPGSSISSPKDSSANGAQQSGPSRSSVLSAAWRQAMLNGRSRSYRMENGWHVLTMQLDDQNGQLTVKTRRNEDNVSVSLGLSDPKLRSLISANTNRLQETLQAEYDENIDFSLATEQEGSSADSDAETASHQRSGHASTGAAGTTPEKEIDNPQGRVLYGSYEWIG